MIFFPDTPEKTTAFYLDSNERERAIQRLVEDDREPVGAWSWDLVPRILRSWQFYLLTVLWMFWQSTVGKVGNTVFQLFLKYDQAHQWSVYQINNIPTAINGASELICFNVQDADSGAGFNVVMVMLVNVYVDATGRRMIAAIFSIASLMFGTICLVIWDIPLGLRVAAYLLAACDGPLSPLFMAWANILCGKDKQVRAMTIAMMNAFGNATTTIIQQFAYPVTDAPEYRVGFKTSLGLICGLTLWVFVVRYFEVKSTKMAKRDVETIVVLDKSVYPAESEGKDSVEMSSRK